MNIAAKNQNKLLTNRMSQCIKSMTNLSLCQGCRVGSESRNSLSIIILTDKRGKKRLDQQMPIRHLIKNTVTISSKKKRELLKYVRLLLKITTKYYSKP